MSLQGMNRTGLDADREDALACGMVEASAEEEFDRVLALDDRLSEMGPAPVGRLTAFSPRECAVFAAALDVLPTARAMVGLVASPADRELEEALRVKALRGSRR